VVADVVRMVDLEDVEAVVVKNIDE